MNKKRYSSAIKKTPFTYLISRKIGKLILENKDKNEIDDICFNNNSIEIASPDRRREIINVVYSRLLILDKYLLNEFVNGDVDTSKFILVYAIAKSDSLFFDFLFEVYREALLGNKNYISLDDFDMFFIQKKEEDSIVAAWGKDTLYCLSKGYRNILVESGMGKRQKRNIVVNKVLINPMVEDYITTIGDKNYLSAMEGV